MNAFGRSACCSLALLAAGALAAHGDEVGVQGVSPGEAERVVEATSACPSFSWSAIEGASAYRLALFEVRADGSLVRYEIFEPPRRSSILNPPSHQTLCTSLAIGLDGFPVVGSCTSTPGLRVVKCTNPSCRYW